LPGQRYVEERLEIVDQRQRIGDWEVDNIIGKGYRQAIVTLAERNRVWLCCAKLITVRPDWSAISWSSNPNHLHPACQQTPEKMAKILL